MSAAVALDFPDSHYDPQSGRFLSQDPLGLAAGDTNLYRYVFNNPLKYTDPMGMEVNGHIYTPSDFNAALNTPAGKSAINSGFIGPDLRFVYTESGVIDMRHAQAAFENTRSLINSGVPAGKEFTWYREPEEINDKNTKDLYSFSCNLCC